MQRYQWMAKIVWWDQAEMIHAGWIYKNGMAVSLLDACMFDIRDALILKDQLKQFEGGSCSDGSGWNEKQRTKRAKNREKIAARQFGRDLLKFGIKESAPVQYCVTSDNGKANPPAKTRKIIFDDILEKRIANAKTNSTSLKVRLWKIINVRKREHRVSTSLEGKKNYLVTICNVPSCSCPDFTKRGI